MFPAIRTKGDTEFMIHFHYLPGNGTVRLSEATRRLAERYLESDEIAKTAIGENFSFVPDPARGVFANYAENIRLIAEHAPLRILPGAEKGAGSPPFPSSLPPFPQYAWLWELSAGVFTWAERALHISEEPTGPRTSGWFPSRFHPLLSMSGL